MNIRNVFVQTLLYKLCIRNTDTHTKTAMQLNVLSTREAVPATSPDGQRYKDSDVTGADP